MALARGEAPSLGPSCAKSVAKSTGPNPTGPENRHVVTINLVGRSKDRSYVRKVLCRGRSYVGRSYVIALKYSCNV